MKNKRRELLTVLMQLPDRQHCKVLIVLSCVALNLASLSASAEVPSTRLTDSQVSIPSPIAAYCGVESLYRALRAVGKDVALADLIKPEYIGSKQGSSAEELEQAAKDLGAYVRPMTRMTIRMLKQTRLPIILHVKSELGADKYDHWVLFMGVVDGKAKIYDGQKAEALMPFDELAARWNGNGLVVSNTHTSGIRYRLSIVGPLLLYVGVAALAVGVITRVSQPRGPTAERGWLDVAPNTVVQTAGLLLIAVTAMCVARIGSQAGFLSNESAVAAIQDSSFGAFLPKVSTRELAYLLYEDSVAIVDARLKPDYQAGHLKGAISIPVGSSAEQCQQAMSRIAKNKRIIIYSHSNGCDYGERVAKELIAQGYEDIWLFRGGWVEWEKHYPSPNRVTQVATSSNKSGSGRN